MTEIENETLIHQILFERFENYQVKNVLGILARANKKITELIKATKIIASKKKYKEVSKQIHDAVDSVAMEYQQSFDIDDILTEEMKSQLLIIENGIYADKTFKMPGLKQVKESVMFKPIEALNHRTFEETFSYFGDNLYQTWDSAIRTGFLAGQTTSDIVKSVMGSATGIENDLNPNRMAQIRKSVELNTRTILQAFADESHRAVFEENEDVIEGYKILATLDRRTCLLCGSLENKTYKKLSDVPGLPIHYNCRCVLVVSTPYDKVFEGKGHQSLEK